MDTTQNKKSSKYLYLMLIYFVFIRIFSNMHASLIPALTQSIAPDVENLKLYNSYLSMSLSFGSLICSPLWGKFIDKYGVKPIIIITSITFTAAQLLISFSPSILIACIGRFCAGASLSGVIISAMTYLISFTDSTNREKTLAVNTALSSVLSTFSMLVGGYISVYGLRTTFIVQAFLFVGSMIIMNILIPKPPTIIRKKSSDTNTVITENKEMSYGELLKTYKGKIVSVAIICSMTMMCGTLAGTTFNTILCYDYGFDSKVISQFGFLMGIFSAIVMLLYNFKLSKKLKTTATLLIGGIGMLVTIVIFIPVAFLGFFLQGTVILIAFRCFSTLLAPAYQNLMASIDQANRGKLMSLITLMESTGMLIGNLISPNLSKIHIFAPYIGFLPFIILLAICAIWANNLFNVAPVEKV